ncbi:MULTISPECIES: hypothetical protein [unclassified Lentimicrobium]|uniref:fluoroquinolone export ABC transporter permease subunit n=1 Tax=unclassified Lentimicrobium TaxID=2677434 RepID=UPI0015535641|nr:MULTISPECIES: hypothetical protein [unclassified Lentimicrobium]NPD44085.1 hypothetical protein [Lentimicrobium sp. S6]NPD86732.1 hypothetical protein [Lentimicrobium sp. L6]
MKSFITQIRWQFVILYKNNLIAISIAVTAIYALIFYLIKDLPNVEPFLTLLIYIDPAIIGLFFIGLSVIMEHNENVLPALFVTPVSYHHYLLSKIIALSIVGWACASGMTLAILGFDVQWLHFSAGVFFTCIIFSLLGLFVVSFTTEFLSFMLRSIPLMLTFSLPLFNYFGLSDISLFQFSPIQGPLDLTVFSFDTQTEIWPIIWAYLSSIIWIPLLYFVVYRTFVKRIIKAS